MKRRVADARDRAHFEAIGIGERRSEADQIERAATTPPGERIRTGIELGAAIPCTQATLAEIDARVDGQAELARRRMALGLGLGARQ